MTDTSTPIGQQYRPQVFCGLSALVDRLADISVLTDSWEVDDEIRAVIAELRLLDDALCRLRYQRSFVDDRDIDQAIDRLRSLENKGGA